MAATSQTKGLDLTVNDIIVNDHGIEDAATKTGKYDYLEGLTVHELSKFDFSATKVKDIKKDLVVKLLLKFQVCIRSHEQEYGNKYPDESNLSSNLLLNPNSQPVHEMPTTLGSPLCPLCPSLLKQLHEQTDHRVLALERAHTSEIRVERQRSEYETRLIQAEHNCSTLQLELNVTKDEVSALRVKIKDYEDLNAVSPLTEGQITKSADPPSYSDKLKANALQSQGAFTAALPQGNTAQQDWPLPAQCPLPAVQCPLPAVTNSGQATNSTPFNTARKGTAGAANSDDALAPAARPSKHVQKGIFLTRASSNTTPGIIGNFVKRHTGIDAKITKLKTKYDWYNSFQIECDAKDYNRLLDADLWPKGLLVKPFIVKANPENNS